MPVVTFPGVTGVKQIDGTNPVGISPGQFVLIAFAGSNASTTGTLTVGDGVNAAISFPNCFRQYDDLVVDNGKKYRTIRLLDRRYRLMMGFPVAGHWNQLDDRKKLIPWTVASPYQLAKMLAAAMGETLTPTLLSPEGINDIDLPGGLAQPENIPLGIPAPGPRDKVIRPAGEFYRCGTNAPQTRTNPTVYWNGQTPAAVLMQNLCETYGRIFCPDPTTSSTSTIWPMGSGTTIPAGGVHVSDGTARTADPLPATVTAKGNPTRYTARLRVRPVVPEWDGTWVPPEIASYAPARAGQKMRCVARLNRAFGVPDTTRIFGLTINEVPFQAASPASLAAALATLAGLIPGADLRTAGITATVVGDTLQIDHPVDGVEFEITTASSSNALAGSWIVECTRAPITGPRDGQPVTEVTWVGGAFVTGATLYSVTVTIGGGGPVTYTSSLTATDANAALEEIADAINASGTNVVAEWAPGKMVVTGTVAGTAVTVAGGANGGQTVTDAVIAGTTFPPKGWEKAGFPGFVGYASVATPRLSLDQAVRLTNEHWCRTYQVVTEDPRPRPDEDAPPVPAKTIPVPGYPDSPVDNRHRLILQNSRPEPVSPAPERLSVFDLRTLKPFSLETYNGYATDRPNIAWGSVHPFCIQRNGLTWLGGTYLNNTALRQRLPFPFRTIDPQHQVIQFDQPLFRILGQGANTGYLPAELVIEVGCTVLEPGTSAPSSPSVSVNPGGPGPAIVRIFPDIEDEVVGAYDEYHTVTGWTFLTQEQVGSRGTYYAQGVADTFQNVAGQSRRHSGILNVPTDGKTRVVNWAISGDQIQTAVGVSCEISRVILPLPARRRDENLPADAVRSMENMNSDFKRSDAIQNALKWLNRQTRGTQ